MALKGIDISHHQKGMDLSKIECDFVIIKATEGIGYVDECCDGFFQQALKLGKKIGFYHFARPVNDAVKEAQYFYSQTKNYFHHAIPVLDWEMENKWDVAWAKRWLDEVYRLSGVKPMIYMSLSVVNAYDWSSVVAGDYGLWVARYGAKPTVKWWSFYAMWQYTSTERLAGWNGNLDSNYFYGTFDAWDKYAGVKAEPEPEPVPVPDPEPVKPVLPEGFSDSDVGVIAKLVRWLIKIFGVKIE